MSIKIDIKVRCSECGNDLDGDLRMPDQDGDVVFYTAGCNECNELIENEGAKKAVADLQKRLEATAKGK